LTNTETLDTGQTKANCSVPTHCLIRSGLPWMAGHQDGRTVSCRV